MRLAYQAQDCKHIVGYRSVDAPQIYGVPSAIFLGVVPSQEEIGDAACLTGILPGDPEQSFEGEPGGMLIIRGQIQFQHLMLGDEVGPRSAAYFARSSVSRRGTWFRPQCGHS